MKSDILIVSDALLEPPSEPMAFRTVTMMCHYDLKMDILLHTTQEMKDLYYNWMKPLGLMDYVNYILNEFEWENGIRIDVVKFYPDTVVVKVIRVENQLSLIGQIKSITGLPCN